MTGEIPPTEDAELSMLAHLAAALIPGDGVWPAADRPGIVTAAVAFAAATPSVHAGVRDALERAAEAGVENANDSAGALLARLETHEPGVFAALRTAVMVGYYTDPEVLAVLEARSGMPAGPTMPHGLLTLLPPSASPDLSRVVAAGVRWRCDGTETSAAVRRQQEQNPGKVWTAEEIATWPR